MSAKVEKSKKHDTLVIVSENNPEFGSIIVRETRDSLMDRMTSNGFLGDVKTRIGLLKGKVEDLKAFNFVDGQIVPLKVIYKESTEPFYVGQDPKRYPEFNKDGSKHAKSLQVITTQGAPIYVNKLVVGSNSPEEDILLPMDREPVQANTTSTAVAQAKAKVSIL